MDDGTGTIRSSNGIEVFIYDSADDNGENANLSPMFEPASQRFEFRIGQPTWELAIDELRELRNESGPIDVLYLSDHGCSGLQLFGTENDTLKESAYSEIKPLMAEDGIVIRLGCNVGNNAEQAQLDADLLSATLISCDSFVLWGHPVGPVGFFSCMGNWVSTSSAGESAKMSPEELGLVSTGALQSSLHNIRH